MLRVYLDTQIVTYLSRPDDIAPLAREIGVEPSRLSIDETDLANYEAEALRRRYRATIANTAGDTETLLGTTADAAALMLYHMAVMADGLSKAQSLAEMRAAAEAFAALTAQFRADVDTGTVRLPHRAKGSELDCMAEVSDRVTKVADVFQSQSQPQSPEA